MVEGWEFLSLFYICFPNIPFIEMENLTKLEVLNPKELPYDIKDFVSEEITEDKIIKYINIPKIAGSNEYFNGLLPSKTEVDDIWVGGLKKTLTSSDNIDKDIIKYIINKFNKKYVNFDAVLPSLFYKDLFQQRPSGRWEYWGVISLNRDEKYNNKYIQEFKWIFKESSVVHKKKSLYKTFFYFANKYYRYNEIIKGIKAHFKDKNNAKRINNIFVKYYEEYGNDVPNYLNGITFSYYDEKNATNPYLTLKNDILKIFNSEDETKITFEELYYGFYLYHEYFSKNINFPTKIDITTEGKHFVDIVFSYNYGNMPWLIRDSDEREKMTEYAKNNDSYISMDEKNQFHLYKNFYLDMLNYTLESNSSSKGIKVKENTSLIDIIKIITAMRTNWYVLAKRLLGNEKEILSSENDMQNFRDWKKAFLKKAEKDLESDKSFYLLDEDDKNEQKLQKVKEELKKDKDNLDEMKIDNDFIMYMLKLMNKYKKFISKRRKKKYYELLHKYTGIPEIPIRKNHNQLLYNYYININLFFQNIKLPLNNVNELSSFSKKMFEIKNELSELGIETTVNENQIIIAEIGKKYDNKKEDFINGDLLDKIIKNTIIMQEYCNKNDYYSLEKEFHDFKRSLAFMLNKFAIEIEIEEYAVNFREYFIDENIYNIIMDYFDLNWKVFPLSFICKIIFDDAYSIRKPIDLYKQIKSNNSSYNEIIKPLTCNQKINSKNFNNGFIDRVKDEIDKKIDSFYENKEFSYDKRKKLPY